MQSIQDVIGFLSLVRGISRAEVKFVLPLLEHLKPALQWGAGIGGIVWAKAAVEYEVAKGIITNADFIPWLMILISPFVMMLPTPDSGVGSVALKSKGLEARWKGGIAFSLTAGGILLLFYWKKA